MHIVNVPTTAIKAKCFPNFNVFIKNPQNYLNLLAMQFLISQAIKCSKLTDEIHYETV